MKSISLVAKKDELAHALETLAAFAPSVVFAFMSPSFFRDESLSGLLRHKGKTLSMFGCSTAGEISNDGYSEDSVSFLAIHFETTRIKMAQQPMLLSEDSYSAGRALAADLMTQDLRAVILLGPGTHVNGSAIVRGARSILPPEIVISGGLASDDARFKETYTLCNGKIDAHSVIGLGLYGEDISVSCGSDGGWRPFGPARRVTRAEDNILYELDGRPALHLYKQYLGDKAKDLPASGLSYPFAILRNDRSTSGIIRSALDIDHDKGALILAGEIPQGCQVCLMHADTNALTQGAAQAAAEALRTHQGSEENGCALLISCVGRRIVLGFDVDDEIESVTDSFLAQTPVAGYYSYGEICSYRGTGRTELHNQTMTITYLTERQSRL